MLKPSDAHLWARCSLAGSLIDSGEYHVTHDDNPAPVSDARREGICAHWAADAVLSGETTVVEIIGHTHPNGWQVDDEMAAHIADYVEYVRRFGTAGRGEQTIGLYGLIRGRLDYGMSLSSDDTIRIFDLKYGWRLVEATENFVMLCYGLALHQPGKRIELHIYQPRPQHPDGPARVWAIEADAVAGWRRWLNKQARDCFDAPVGTPGAHCGDCPAAGTCHALAANTYAIYETLRAETTDEYSPFQLAAYLRFLDAAQELVDAKRQAVRAEADARIRRGTVIPGWCIEPRIGNRKFTVSTEQRRMATGLDPYKSVEKTPAEMEREGAPKQIMDTITTRPHVGRKLTQNIEGMAKRMFGEPVK